MFTSDNEELSKQTRGLLYAFEVGYHVRSDGTVVSGQGNVLKLRLSKRGYLSFCIQSRTKGLKLRIDVHRLSAYQKYGELLFENGIEVRHLNGDPLNNRVENIAIGSHSENMMDQDPEVRKVTAKRAASHRRVLTDDQLAEFRMDRASGMTYRQLREKYGLAKSTVSYIVNKKTYR